MKDILTFCVMVLEVLAVGFSQRIAPGVPPQQYQQPHQLPPQHIQPQYQQMPQQGYHQQPPVQQQPNVQMHQQPYQQQAPVQTPPVGHQHPHAQHGGQPQQLLNSANMVLEKDHIQEHLDVPIDTSKMSEQELQFHYFKMHDADNNNKLDGCELIKSLIHWHAENEEGEKQEVKVQNDSDLEAMIDPILREMDSNNDGYVDYAEFKKAS